MNSRLIPSDTHAVRNDACAVPPWPLAGARVADEIARIDPATIPATTEWLGRLRKFKQQLPKAQQ